MAQQPVQQPYPTVYVNNLNERVKVSDLTDALRGIFEEFGNVVGIVAKTSVTRRGQAFVVFDNQESAMRAMEALDGFPLHGKPIRTHKAYQPSDATMAQLGERGLEEHKKRRIAQKEYRTAMAKKAGGDAGRHEIDLKRPGAPVEADRKAKAPRVGGGLKSTAGASSAVIPDEYLPPNKILFIRDIPEGYDIDNLSQQFSIFEGFKEVRTVPGRAGIAFVEYAAEVGAIAAKERMGNKVLPGAEDQPPIRVTYQRQ